MGKTVTLTFDEVFKNIETSERVLDDLYASLADLKSQEEYLEEEEEYYLKIIRKRGNRRRRSHKNEDIHKNFENLKKQLKSVRRRIRNIKITISQEKARLRRFSQETK